MSDRRRLRLRLRPDSLAGLSFPRWYSDIRSAVEALPRAELDRSTGEWTSPDRRAAVRLALGFGFSIKAPLLLELAGPMLEEVRRPIASAPSFAGGLEGVELYPYQRDAAAAVAAFRRFYLADDAGTGKSVTALSAANAAGAFPLLVVCPAAVRTKWATVEAARLPGRSVTILEGRSGPVEPADVIGTGYATLADRLADLRGLGLQGVIFDEAHCLKTEGAVRTKAALELAQGIPFRLALSATPMPNSRPIELLPQLEVVGILEELQDLGILSGREEFIRRYCQPRIRRIGGRQEEDLNGAANLLELWERLAPWYIQRTKAEVLGELPPRHREIRQVPIDLEEYQQLDRDLREWVEKAEDREEAERGRISKLSAHVGKAKVPAALEWISKRLEATDEKVVVCFVHRAVGKAIAAAFDVPLVIGGQKPKDRDYAIRSLTDDPTVRVLPFQVTAGGVGLDLQAASRLLIAELPWSAGELEQAVNRVHRIGQHRPVEIVALVAPQTIDDAKLAALRAKRARTHANA